MAIYTAFRGEKVYLGVNTPTTTSPYLQNIYLGNAGTNEIDWYDIYNIPDLFNSSIPDYIEGGVDGFSSDAGRTKSYIFMVDGEERACMVGFRPRQNGYDLGVYYYYQTNVWKRLYNMSRYTLDDPTRPVEFYFGSRTDNNWLVFYRKRYDGYEDYSSLSSKTPTDIFPSFYQYTFDSDNPPVIPPDSSDPFDPGGDSGEGGGGGDFNNDSDFIGIPGVPDYSITNTGFMSLFAPTSAQLKSLSSYMWDTLNLENWRKIFADPMDAILGLTLVPVSPDRGGLSPVKVGNISTGVEMYTLSNQIKTVDCGSINVSEYWGAYLDFDPFTKIEIFLPFIGFRPLKSDDVMGKTVHVLYYIDLLSGSCVAFVECGGDLLYTFPGSMGYQIPITSSNWSNFLSSTVSMAGSAISTVATGGATAPLTVPTMATSAVNMFKQNVDRSGTVAGNAGFLSQNCVYMTVTRPKQALPKDQNTYTGYPSLMTVKLSDLSGYTVVRDIHLEGVTATDNEIAEIESLLKEGVII